MNLTGQNDDIQFKFPFADYSDEELDKYISYSKRELHLRVNQRDFEFFEVLGRTLIQLETEKEIRKINKYKH